MKSKNRKIFTALTALVMTFSMGTSISAETLLDISASKFVPSESSVILNYNPENNTYELVDEDGNTVLEDIENEEQETNEENAEVLTWGTTLKVEGGYKVNAVTTAPSSTSSSTTTTTTTIPGRYIARYRAEASSEAALYTTTKPITTTTKKTTTTTTTIKTTTTTKKTTTTTTTKKTTTTTTKSVYKGIDVSKHQGTINWTKVKNAGIDFVMIRAGYGKCADQVDPKFKENITGAQSAGIDCGVYWYSYALNTSDALQEATLCYNTIKNYKLTYPVAFDIEDPTQMNLTTTQISNIIKVFCDYLEYKKYYVSVYSFASMLNTKMNPSVLSAYDIWVAHINTSKPNYSGSYGMWQYSHTGRVNGISGDVDLDYAYKNYPGMIKGWKLNGNT